MGDPQLWGSGSPGGAPTPVYCSFGPVSVSPLGAPLTTLCLLPLPLGFSPPTERPLACPGSWPSLELLIPRVATGTRAGPLPSQATGHWSTSLYILSQKQREGGGLASHPEQHCPAASLC